MLYLVCFVLITYGSIRKYAFGADFIQQLITAYVYNGVNPYTDMDALASTIGEIPANYATSPWGLTLGNLFYCGFTSMKNAYIWFLILSVLSIIIASIIAFKYCDFLSNKYIILPLFYFSYGLFGQQILANASCIIDCFILISIMIHKKHPYLAGILLAFAMIKPQTAGLVVLVMLFEKRFKTISTIGVIDSIGYIIACVILKISPITLMQQFLNANTGGSHAYVGIFSFLYLHGHGIDKMQILIMSMVLGTFLTTMGYVNIRKIHCNENLHNFLIFIPALLCTQFWSYAFDTNKGLLIIPMIVLIYLFLTSKKQLNSIFHDVFACIISYMDFIQ
jgi:hypothetical protein